MHNDQILWVTSYPARLAEISGKPLVETWNGPGRLLVYTEGIPEADNLQKTNVFYSSLDSDPILTKFLTLNAEVIPQELGGRWTGPCKCDQDCPLARKYIRRHQKKYHKLPCPEAWFCKHASRWFRKVVAMQRATQFDPSVQNPVYLWIDADCVFTKPLDVTVVDSWFQGRDLFYFKHTREASETGLIGWRGKGLDVHKKMFELYVTRAYLKQPRWDDSYTFDRARAMISGLLMTDLARGLSGHADVIPSSIVGPYITHSKGRHGRITGIFK